MRDSDTSTGAPAAILPATQCTVTNRQAASHLSAHPGDDLKLHLVARLLEKAHSLGVSDALQRVAVHRQQTVPTAQLA